MNDIRRRTITAVLTETFAVLDRIGVTRTSPFAAGVGAGIDIESATRRVALAVRGRPVPPVNVHVGGDGPAVVLINGWSASGLVWPAQLVERLERRFTVFRVDNRGTGWSRRCLHPYSIADLAGDVRAAIEEHAFQRPIFVGMSMGGMIAQEIAIRWPELPGHVVLLATSPPSPEYTPPRRGAAAALFAGATVGDLESQIRAAWLPVAGPGFTAGARELMDEMVRTILQRPTPSFAIVDQARAVAAWRGADRLSRITAPTTIMHGAADPLVPVRNGMRLSQLIPDARYIDLPGVGHLVPYEAVTEVGDVIESVEVPSP